MKVRPALLWLHRYLGLVAAAPIVLLTVTGAVLVFEAEIDRALHPAYWSVSPRSTPVLRPQALVDAVQKSFPGNPVVGLRFAPAPDVAAELSLKNGLSVAADPYTGRVLGTRRRQQLLTTKIHEFHTTFLLGPWGERLTGISALALLVLSVTGIILWWRRRSLGVRWSASWRRVNLDAHYSFGFWGLIPWLVMAATGALMTFDTFGRPMIYNLTGTKPAVPPPLLSIKSYSSLGRISADAALAASADALPGADVTVLGVPSKPEGVFLAYMKFPEDHTPAGRSRVAIDQYTGRVVWVENARTAPAGTRVLNLNRPVHTGDVFGWPTRILAFVACVGLAVQTVTGIIMWWPKKNSSRRKTADARPATASVRGS